MSVQNVLECYERTLVFKLIKMFYILFKSEVEIDRVILNDPACTFLRRKHLFSWDFFL